MSWNQIFIPLCYRHFLLNQKKNVGVKCVYQKYQIQNEKKEMALIRSFVQPGNSFQKFTETNSKNIQTKCIELCLSVILFYDCTSVFVFQTIMLKFGLSIQGPISKST